MTKTAAEIAQCIQGTVVGDTTTTISGVTNMHNPQAGFVTFIDNPDYLADVETTAISCIIVPQTVTQSKKTIIQCDNPKLAFAILLKEFYPQQKFSRTISEQACVAKTVKFGTAVTVEEFVSVKDNAAVGNNTALLTGCYIGKNVTIGTNCIIHPHVAIYDNCVIGNNVIIHANSVIGSDGFGYVNTGSELAKVPQVGNVVLEDDVEIGACTTIDRATMGSTVIRKGVKLDNQVQVAHNVEIGDNTAASAHVGISGSTKIGKQCTIAGAVGFADHCEIGNNVIIGAQAGIPSKKKIRDGQIFLGSPARPIEQMKKQFGAMAILPRIIEKVGKLDERVKALEGGK